MRIFEEPADYEYFEDLMCFYPKSFGINLHMAQLRELKTASCLVTAPNRDTKPKIEDLEEIFQNIIDLKDRNNTILQSIEKGYSQPYLSTQLKVPCPSYPRFAL
ncbi:MAG: hypothetical protein Q9M36_00785 [Sulfurovum sp.]|nr:hypothetical protein [Sulfurovum sp.]